MPLGRAVIATSIETLALGWSHTRIIRQKDMKVCFTTNVEAIELLNTETAQEAQTF
jgi:hypothetical protein